MHTILFEKFVNVKAGDPFRLFPFGKITKNGKTRDITPEFAASIKLPHFKPAIKLGSHEDTTPAGGHIISLEVRPDGLYAVPELNDKGAQAMQDGAYRYHSPEIIWEGGLEDPTTGEAISAPLIVGDAWLHMPHLGESAALYSIEEITQETNMDNMSIPVSLWDKFIAPLLAKNQEVKEVIVEKLVEPEDYAATKTERDNFKAQIEKQAAEIARKGRVEKFDAELKDTKADPALSDLLADLDPEKAEAVMKQFKALSAQIDASKITGEDGTTGDGGEGDPQASFNAAVLNLMKTDNITNYVTAFDMAKLKHADLFKAWSTK